jgi:hypothetical protein
MRQGLRVRRHHLAVRHHAQAAHELLRRELPQPPEESLGPSAREHDGVAVLHPHEAQCEQRQVLLPLARRHHRKCLLAARARRYALSGERTDRAARIRRRARGGAELHQSLVEVARGVALGESRHHLAGRRPQGLCPRGRLDVDLDAADSREHPRDVAVHERRPLSKRDRGDRPRGVGPDPRDRAQIGGAPRHASPGHHRLCARAQVAGARVVAEAGPRGEHVVERRRREGLHRRKPRHPALPVGNHRSHARLLAHDFGDPDRVWIA